VWTLLKPQTKLVQNPQRAGAASGMVARANPLPLLRRFAQSRRKIGTVAFHASAILDVPQTAVTAWTSRRWPVELPPRPASTLARRQLFRVRLPECRTPRPGILAVALAAFPGWVSAGGRMALARPPHDATAPLTLGDLLTGRRAYSRARRARVCSSLQAQHDPSEMNKATLGPCRLQGPRRRLLGSAGLMAAAPGLDRRHCARTSTSRPALDYRRDVRPLPQCVS
jgi:hypothetical protein